MMRIYIVFVFLFVPTFILCASEIGKQKELQQKSGENVALLSKQHEDEKIFTSLIKSIFNFASNGFKTGLESSMRSLFDKPISSAVAAISVVIGAVALLAFYESPISPLPVPPLPDPPVGRFPPEYPVWPPPKANQRMPYYQAKRAGIPYAMNNGHGYNNLANNFMYPINVLHRSDGKINNQIPLPIQHHNYHAIRNMNQHHPVTSTVQESNHLKNSNSNQFLNSNSELNNNKVIDYNNKRIAMELMKMNSANQTNS